MDLHSRTVTKNLRGLQVFFYALFIFLWFKDNYPLLKTIPVPAWIPLLGLLAVTAVRAFARLKDPSRPKVKLRITRDWGIIVLLVLLAAAVHAPYLAHSAGLMDSDEAIPALQGKHIAEGKLPTVFYYGARFQGSFPQHLYALVFKIFGYSAFLTKLAAFLAFAAFLAVQYLLLKRIFSRGFALAAGLFTILPFTNLILASFDVGSGFAVLLLLGSVIFTLTQRIYAEGKDHLLGTLGFVLGLTFWTHQITIIFILTAGAFLFLRYRFQVRNYFKLALYLALGFLPALVSEVYWGFPIVRMLFGGESIGTVSGAKLANGTKLALDLISSGPGLANVVYLLILCLGLILLAARAVRDKKIAIPALFVVYTLAYAGVYILSSSSSSAIIRYLFILYLVLPVLFPAAFLWIKPEKLRLAATAAFILMMFFASQAGASLAHYRSVVKDDANVRKVLDAVDATGERTWKGDYWGSYLLTAVSKERIIVASTNVERYPYYQLLYDTESAHANRIFFRNTPQQIEKSLEFTELLRRLGKRFETKEIGDWLLVYGVTGEVYEKNLLNPPDAVPEVSFTGVTADPYGLVVNFSAKTPIPAGGYRLNVVIPGFCALFAPLDPGDRFTVRIPYPADRRVRLRYYLDFEGLVLDSTTRETECALPAPPPGAERNDLEYLSGFGPREQATGNEWQSLERDVRFRVNRPLDGTTKITLSLFSPFLFEDIWWHGDFAQEVEILAGGRTYARKTLKDGFNTLTIEGPFPPGPDGSVLVELKFRYQMVVSIARDHWKTAAYLVSLTLD
jgi:hypothetical protein